MNPSSATRPSRRIDTAASRKKTRRGEEGYILIAVLFLVAMVLVTLAIAAPKVAADIQRDREVELMHRAMQYRRAIQLYYRKFNAYPPNMDALEKTQNIRFLRKRYIDPATGKDEWKLIHFGENKTPTAMGFFGQPLGGVGGSTLAGIGPGGMGQNIGSPIGGSTYGSSPLGASPIGGGATGGGPIGANPIGSTPTVTAPSTGTDPNPGNSGNAGGAPGTTSTTGTDSGTANGSAGSSTGNPGGSIFASSTSPNGQTFGGGGIIGVESTSPKGTILEYKKKKHFNEWEFVYDPLQERMTISNNAGTIGTPAGGSAGQFGLQPQPGAGFPAQPSQPGLPQSPSQPPQPQQPPQQ
jgi:type II secretory pathway pseudopilin PulG